MGRANEFNPKEGITVKLHIQADLHNFGRLLDIHIAKIMAVDSERRLIAKPLEFVEIGEDKIDDGFEPAFRMSKADGQNLMDELWRCGIRPSEGSGSAGSLAATERHLADMRTIAMGSLQKAGALPSQG